MSLLNCTARINVYIYQNLIVSVAENFIAVEREEQEDLERAIIIDLPARSLQLENQNITSNI
jgi:hypothetical protein